MRNEQFGYTKVTIERPLRVRYVLNDSARARCINHSTVARLDPLDRSLLTEAINACGDFETANQREVDDLIDSWATFPGKVRKNGVRGSDRKPTKSLREALLGAMSIPDPSGDIVLLADGKPKASTKLRDAEYVQLTSDIETHLAEHVAPFVSDAWADRSKDKVGYEVPFTKLFFRYEPPRRLEEIEADLQESQRRILDMLNGVVR